MRATGLDCLRKAQCRRIAGMDTLAAAPDVVWIVPGYPPFLRGCVRRRLEQLEARCPNFRIEVVERFRQPLRVEWARQFWDRIGSEAGAPHHPKQETVARRAKV